MRIMVAVVMVVTSSLALADEVAIAPRGGPKCEAKGAVWFELDYLKRAPGAASAPTADQYDIMLYANGAVTQTRRWKYRGKAQEASKVVRCLSPDTMALVEADLKGAKWTATKKPTSAPCSAPPAQSTVVKIYGKQVIIESPCPVTVLDAKSAEMLAKLKNRVPQPDTQACLDNPLAKGCI